MSQSPEAQLRSFIAKFSPKMGKLIRECRAIMRKRFPAAFELVYDNYNFFVSGILRRSAPRTASLSLAANSKGIGLSFYYGAGLPDPHKILKGSGNQNRFVRLSDAAVLGRPEVAELINAAEAQADPKFLKKVANQLIIRSVSEKQRPRR